MGHIERRRRWFQGLLVFVVLFITIASVMPDGSLDINHSFKSMDLDKIWHFVGFAGLILIVFGAIQDLGFRQGVWSTAWVMVFGGAIELGQHFIPYRTFNPADILANFFGAVFGILLWMVYKRFHVGRLG